jgi:hypothetical protein
MVSSLPPLKTSSKTRCAKVLFSSADMLLSSFPTRLEREPERAVNAIHREPGYSPEKGTAHPPNEGSFVFSQANFSERLF